MIKKLCLAFLLAGSMLAVSACGVKEEVETKAEETVVIKADNRLEAIEELGKIRIAISLDYAPFAFTMESKEGAVEYVGSDVKLGTYIAENLGVMAEFNVMEFEECLDAVKEGSVDMVLLGMLPKTERKAMMDFTDIYYEPGKQVLLVQKNERLELNDLEAYAGKTVAAQYGTLQAQLVTEQMPESYMELTDDISGAVMKLRMGAVEGVALDESVAEDIVQEYTELAVSNVELEYTQSGIVAGVVKDQPELLAKINEIIAQVTKEKLYLEWLEEAHELAASLPER